MSWKYITANIKNLKIISLLIFILALFFGTQIANAETCNIQCFRYDPVCGVNGKTYGCGLPESNCYGVKIAYAGACKLETSEVVCALSDKKSKILCATLLEKEAFEKYLKNNISKLAPHKESLNGVLFVTKIIWQPNRVALVTYEDGRTASRAQVKMVVIYKKGHINSVKAAYFKVLKDK